MDDGNDVYFKVIWTRNEKLDVAELQWFDEPDYDFALNKKFATEKEAKEAAKLLSDTHDIPLNFNLNWWYGHVFDE